jgi:hypothetical protein
MSDRTRLDEIIDEELSFPPGPAPTFGQLGDAVRRIAERVFRHGAEQRERDGRDVGPMEVQPAPANGWRLPTAEEISATVTAPWIAAEDIPAATTFEVRRRPDGVVECRAVRVAGRKP